MNMKSGVVDISKTLEFAEKHPTIPCGRNQEFRQYSKLCDTLTINIPETSGWYFWIPRKNRVSAPPIYIGKADKTDKNNSLRYRINYELKTERICFWTDIVGEKKAFDDHHNFFKHGKFDNNAKRAQKKRGSKFIIWVSDPDATTNDIGEVEDVLIYQYQPNANVKNKRQGRVVEKLKSASAIFENYRKTS